MAAYTATQNGKASVAATWGGAGTPTSAGDTFDTSTYEVEWDINGVGTALGNGTIPAGGLLWFSVDADTGILFNTTAVLSVASTGELRVGMAGAVIPAAYSAKLHWQQGSSYRNVLTVADGGILNAYGDPTLYGSTKYAVLSDNWSSGQTFYVEGDYTALWAVGQSIWIHKYAAYSNYQTDAVIFTIASVGSFASGKTDFTINEAAPGVTFNAGGTVINITRNVEFIDPGSSTDVFGYGSYTERIRFNLSQSGSNYNVNMSDVVFRGWDRALYNGKNFQGYNIIYLNNTSSTYGSASVVINADIISNSSTSTFSDTINSGRGSKYTGTICSCGTGIASTANIDLRSNLISNGNAFNNVMASRVRGNIIGNNKIFITGCHDILVKQSKIELNATIADLSSTVRRNVVLDGCDVDGADRKLRVYLNSGDILPVISGEGDWQAPPSGFDTIYKMAPNTNCGVQYTAQMSLDAFDNMVAYVESGAQTLTYKIWPDGWATSLDQDDIFVEVTYLDAATGKSTALAVTGAGSFANGAWRDLTVTFNPLQAGYIYFNIRLRKYESGKFVLIDPIWSIA